MASEWTDVRVGDLVSSGVLAINDGYRVRNDELGAQGIPFVRGGDIGDGWINTDTEDYIRPELAARVKAKLTEAEDVAFITKGTVGRAGRLRPGQPPVVFAPQVAYWRVLDRSVLDPRFVFYFMKTHAFQSALDGVKTHGSMVADYVSLSQQHEFCFRFPDIDTQRAIAHVLGSLDDRIELTRRNNETLEAIARAMFKSWFVDFDPVRAKVEGRDMGLPAALADLFPGNLIDSEVGEIPVGWLAGTLEDLSTVNPEVWSKTTRPAEIRYVDLSNVKWGRIDTITVLRAADAPSRAQRVLRPGDTIVGTVRPGNGSYAFISEEGLTASTGFAVLRPRRPEYAELVYLAATAVSNIDMLAHLADGAAYPAVRPELVAATRLARADDKVLIRFSQTVGPLLQRIARNIEHSRTLAAARDALLPRLMSGKLQIDNAETFIERTT